MNELATFSFHARTSPFPVPLPMIPLKMKGVVAFSLTSVTGQWEEMEVSRSSSKEGETGWQLERSSTWKRDMDTWFLQCLQTPAQRTRSLIDRKRKILVRGTKGRFAAAELWGVSMTSPAASGSEVGSGTWMDLGGRMDPAWLETSDVALAPSPSIFDWMIVLSLICSVQTYKVKRNDLSLTIYLACCDRALTKGITEGNHINSDKGPIYREASLNVFNARKKEFRTMPQDKSSNEMGRKDTRFSQRFFKRKANEAKQFCGSS